MGMPRHFKPFILTDSNCSASLSIESTYKHKTVEEIFYGYRN